MPTSPVVSDEVLVRQLAAGRQEAFGRLYRRYASLILNMATQSLDRSTAEEIVQDVFMTVWQRAGVFTPERGTFRAWLLQITHFRVLNELRRRRRRPQTQPDPDGVLLAGLADDGPEPEELALRKFLRSVVQSALEGLSQSQRQVVDLAFFKDLSHTEVAAELRIPLGTAKTRIRSALLRLRGQVATEVSDTDRHRRRFGMRVPA
jgi:RNA polymerase sigma-70 factor (ECF subfamily)